MLSSEAKRLLHGITNPSGSAYQEVMAERSLGIPSYLVSYARTAFKYPADYSIDLRFFAVPPLRGLSRRFLFRFFWENNFDAYHFHSLSTFMEGNQDIPRLKKRNKKLIFQFHGSDIRRLDLAKQRYSGHYANYIDFDPAAEKKKTEKMNYLVGFADLLLVSDYELLEWAPTGAKVAPRIVDAQAISATLGLGLKPDRQKITIFHSPSNPLIKGTKFIEKAVDELKTKYPNLVLNVATRLPHTESLKKMAASDILIDQLLIGAYGKTAIEGMAMGKPVICYIRPYLKEKYYGNLPIISATKENIKDVLDELIAKQDSWSELGKAGIGYVQKNHSREAYAQFIEPEYRKLGIL